MSETRAPYRLHTKDGEHLVWRAQRRKHTHEISMLAERFYTAMRHGIPLRWHDFDEVVFLTATGCSCTLNPWTTRDPACPKHGDRR